MRKSDAEYQAKFRLKNRDRLNEKAREYRLKNGDKIRARARLYRQKNLLKVRAYYRVRSRKRYHDPNYHERALKLSRDYYIRNRAALAQRARLRREKHRDREVELGRKRNWII